MDPEQTRIVRYTGDSELKLAIDIDDAETKIWDEGNGTREIAG